MKKIKNMKNKIILIISIISIVSVFSLVRVNAAESTVSLEAGSSSLKVERHVNNVTDDVNNTFTYTITADRSNPALVEGLPSTMSIVFDKVSPSKDGIAVVESDLDLSKLTFSALGDYKFTIAETESSNDKVYPIDSSIYTFYVTVRNEVDTDNIPTGNLVATLLTGATKDGSLTKEDIVFENKALTHLTITKNVSGDMANKEEYFKFKVTITGESIKDEEYKITGQDSSVSYDGTTINTSTNFKAGQDNYIYLKHGQTVTIGLDGDNNQLQSGVTYTIVEEDASSYNTYINSNSKNEKTLSTTLSNDLAKNAVTYLNNYESSTLTGMLVNIAPFMILILSSIVCFVVINKKVRI